MNIETAQKARLVLLYVLGAAVGGFAGAMVGSYVVDKWLPKEEPYVSGDSPHGDLPEDILAAEEDDEVEVSEEVVEKKERAKKTKPVKTQREDYAKYYKADKEKLSLDELAAEAAKYTAKSSINKAQVAYNLPQIISFEEFTQGDPSSARVTYTYYSGDDTMVDEELQPIPAFEDVLGKGITNKFGTMSDDPDAVYVRNAGVATIYEIVRVKKTYQEDVLGIASDDPRAKVKKLSPKQKATVKAEKMKLEAEADGDEE